MASSCGQLSLRPNKLRSDFDHDGDEVRLRPFCSHARDSDPPSIFNNALNILD